MNIIKIFNLFPTKKDCIDYLEQMRWGDKPVCPYCTSKNTYKLDQDERYRHHCNGCRKTFSVTVNTIMHDTRLPLQKWFLAVSLIGNAKKGISSRQLARDLELPVKTAYSLCQRIRKAMLGAKSPLLQGIVEIDETYIGGKPRYKNAGSKRGRGTKKAMVVGSVERDGSVIAKPVEKFNQKEANNLIMENIDIDNTVVNTDEYRVYDRVKNIVKHDRVNHGAKQYVDGDKHTNTIEGFWAIVKRAYYGQHHHYTKKYISLYIAEATFKYNRRKETQETMFNDIFGGLLSV